MSIFENKINHGHKNDEADGGARANKAPVKVVGPLGNLGRLLRKDWKSHGLGGIVKFSVNVGSAVESELVSAIGPRTGERISGASLERFFSAACAALPLRANAIV